MSTETRNRRSKRSGTSDGLVDPSSSSSSVPTTPLSQADDEKILDEAMGRVLAAKYRLDDLHSSWRSYLSIISLLVVLLAAHQSRGPMTICLSDVKEHNAHVGEDGGESMGFAGAIAQVLRNGICDWVGIVLTGLVAYYLSMDKVPVGDYSPWPYTLSAMLVFVQLSIYFQTKERIGCAGRGLGVAGVLGEGDPDSDDADRTRQFPVGVVFHTAVTISLWFMKFGKDKAEANAEVIQKLKRQMDEAKETKRVKKKGGR